MAKVDGMNTDFKTLVVSIIRTVVPVYVGNAITTTEVALGIDLDNTGLQIAAVSLVTGVWYGAVRLVESRYPKAGWLLGWKATIQYEAPVAG